jgi:transcriptional regulator with XRE-family HTH domain
MEDELSIGLKLKRLRMERGLTQEELASRAYLTKGFISQLERNLTSPSIATLKSILDVLVVLAKGAKTPQQEAHGGEEFGFVLKGRILLWLDQQFYKLKTGDCFSFKSSTKHWVENVGNGEAHVLWVVSPLRFEN